MPDTAAQTTTDPTIDDPSVGPMMTIVIGLFKRRAHETDFNGDAELAMALAVIKAAIEGRIRPRV